MTPEDLDHIDRELTFPSFDGILNKGGKFNGRMYLSNMWKDF